MDRAAMQNFLLFGGGGGGVPQQGMGGGNDQQGQQQQGGGGGNADGQGGAAGGMSSQDFQNQAFAGYPALMRQYLQQQQQQQQQQQGMGGFPNQASFMGGMGGAPGGPQGGGQGPGGAEGAGNNMGQMMAQMNMAQMGGFGGQPGAAGFLPQGLGGGGGGQPGAPDYMDANRMLLQRLQGQNQPEQQFGAGDAANGADPYAENGILGPWSATSAGLLGKMAVNTQDKGKKVRRKPKDKPKRPLSAYNIFFKEERQRILEKIPEGEEEDAKGSGDAKTRKRKKRPHGKIGFENLAKVIGQRWQELTPEQVEYYKSKANEDMKRYKDQMEDYLAKQDDGKKKKDSDDDDSGEDDVKSPAKKRKSEK